MEKRKGMTASGPYTATSNKNIDCRPEGRQFNCCARLSGLRPFTIISLFLSSQVPAYLLLMKCLRI